MKMYTSQGAEMQGLHTPGMLTLHGDAMILTGKLEHATHKLGS